MGKNQGGKGLYLRGEGVGTGGWGMGEGELDGS